MWSGALREIVSFVLLASAALVAIAAIAAKVAVSPKWSRDRFKGWLDQTVGEVVEARLTGRNGGSSLMDSIDRIGVDLKTLSHQNEATDERIDRLSQDVAMLRQISAERGEAAAQRVDALERHLDVLLGAVLHPPYRAVDVTRTRPEEDTP
jgi:DNA mismatch repair protein MutH